LTVSYLIFVVAFWSQGEELQDVVKETVIVVKDYMERVYKNKVPCGCNLFRGLFRIVGKGSFVQGN